MPERSYAAALALGLCTAAVFAPALPLDVVLLGLPAAPVTTALRPAANVVLHALNAALALLLLARLTGRLVSSVVAAALFALHPLRVESIVWVASGHDVLGMTAALVTVLVYEAWSRRGGAWRYGASVVTYAVAVAATPLVSPLPVLLLLLDAWPLGRLDVVAPRGSAARAASRREAAVRGPRGRGNRTSSGRSRTVGSSPEVAVGV